MWALWPVDVSAALRPDDMSAALRPDDVSAALRPDDVSAALRPFDRNMMMPGKHPSRQDHLSDLLTRRIRRIRRTGVAKAHHHSFQKTGSVIRLRMEKRRSSEWISCSGAASSLRLA